MLASGGKIWESEEWAWQSGDLELAPKSLWAFVISSKGESAVPASLLQEPPQIRTVSMLPAGKAWIFILAKLKFPQLSSQTTDNEYLLAPLF